jgi:hypothetical protein
MNRDPMIPYRFHCSYSRYRVSEEQTEEERIRNALYRGQEFAVGTVSGTDNSTVDSIRNCIRRVTSSSEEQLRQ